LVLTPPMSQPRTVFFCIAGQGE